MINIIEGNIIANTLILIGFVIGVLGGFVTTIKKLKEDELLTYSNAPITQVLNRLLFVVGCIMCLFIDFPKTDNPFIPYVAWILFPFMGFIMFLLSWCIAFGIVIALKVIFRWIFASVF